MIRLKHILTEQRMAPWELLGPAAGSLVRQTIQSKVDAIDKQFQDTMNPLYQLKTRLGFAKGQLKINRFLPTTGIKINEFSKKYMTKPLVVSVFAWNFYEEIVNKLKKSLPLNSIIICPLPDFKIKKIC